MANRDYVDIAESLMRQFAEDTGVIGEHPHKRYLWTDAYAVCNFLQLDRHFPNRQHLDNAVAIVDQVHNELGRYSSADTRQGWISGLDDETGHEHPTAGGLRIGKPHLERQPDEPYDPQREWDRDGQYFHYLTKWVHALGQVANATGDDRYRRWAEELAIRSCRAFAVGNGSLHWKMSVDLSRPLVPSMGVHDPLDGLVTSLALLNHTRSAELQGVVDQFERICHGKSWITDDALGIGGLLFDAGRLVQLDKPTVSRHTPLLTSILEAVEVGLHRFAAAHSLKEPASQRLAFRELGLAIGLHALETLYENAPHECLVRVDAIARFGRRGSSIEQFWLQGPHRQVDAWIDHRDINTVMLATSLIPEGILEQ